MTVEVVNGMSFKIEHKCNVELSTHHNSYKFDLQCLVVPEVTGYLPAQHIDIQKSQLPSNIKLADPSFHVPDRMDILIGADWFWKSLVRRTINDWPESTYIIKNKVRMDSSWTVEGSLHKCNSMQPKQNRRH